MQKVLELPQTFCYLYCANFKDMTSIQEKTEPKPYVSREEKNGITQELLKTLFDYKDGFLYWKVNRTTWIKIGDKAGYLHEQKGELRYCMGINGKYYFSSRLIFLYHHGYLPIMVDHENRICNDDRIENLRAADYSNNNKNSTSRKNSYSMYLGVSFDKRDKMWTAQIQCDGKKIYFGYFKSEELAALAYNNGAVRHFKEFANLNIIKLPML